LPDNFFTAVTTQLNRPGKLQAESRGESLQANQFQEGSNN